MKGSDWAILAIVVVALWILSRGGTGSGNLPQGIAAKLATMFSSPTVTRGVPIPSSRIDFPDFPNLTPGSVDPGSSATVERGITKDCGCGDSVAATDSLDSTDTGIYAFAN